MLENSQRKPYHLITDSAEETAEWVRAIAKYAQNLGGGAGQDGEVVQDLPTLTPGVDAPRRP